MRLLTILACGLALAFTGCITSKLNDQALHPGSTFEMVPEDLDLRYQIMTVTSGDARIHTWFFPADEPSGDTVIVCGGNTGNKGLYVPFARELTRAGYHTVLVDYRGYGLSTGEPDLWSLVDDTCAVVREVAEMPETERIALFGMSLGSVVALGTASREETGIRAVVSECTLHPSKALADHVGGFLAGVLGVFVTPTSWDMEEIAAEMPVPVFFIHGTEDSITELARAQLIFDAGEAAPAERYVWIAEGAGHSPEFPGLYGDEYVDRIISFLDFTMKGEGDLVDLTEPREPGNYRRCRALFEDSEGELYSKLGRGVPLHLGGKTLIFNFGSDEERTPEEHLADYREVEEQLARDTHGDPQVAPLYADLWLTLGQEYEEAGRGPDALRAYRQYLSLVPKKPHAWFYFTDAGWDMGWSLNEVADTLQRMSGLVASEEERLELFADSVEWRERAVQRLEFMRDWEAVQRMPAGLPGGLEEDDEK